MGQVTTGIRGILNDASVYDAFQRIAGVRKMREVFVREYVKPQEGASVLDLGCGPGHLVGHFPSVRYLGVDLSRAYVERARLHYGGRAEFVCSDVTAFAAPHGAFDIVLAFGLLHHLDDAQAAATIRLAKNALKTDGVFLTIDTCFADGQPAAARLLAQMDRGSHVRSLPEYLRLFKPVFGSVTHALRGDLLRIPGSYCVATARV